MSNNLSSTTNHSSFLKNVVFGIINYQLIMLSTLNFNYIRVFLYRHMFHMIIGGNASMYPRIKVLSPWKISIGKNVIIGSGVVLDGRNTLQIGNNVNISSNVCLWTMQHDINDVDFKCSGGRVIVEDRVWLATNSTVLPNVIVREGCVLSSNAVLTKNTEAFGVYCGIPAVLKKNRNHRINYSFHGEHVFFE